MRYTLGNGWYVFEASSDDEGTSGGGGGASEQEVVTYTEEALEGEPEPDEPDEPEPDRNDQTLMGKLGELMGDSWDNAVKNNPIPVITKKMRKPGETAAYVRAQGSSLFGIAEGLVLQYRMGAYTQVDDGLLDEDPGLNQLLVSTGSSISQLFTQDMWERHRGVSRYWRHLAAITKSTVFNRIVEPVLLIAAWAAFWCLWNGYLVPVVQAFGEAALEASSGVAVVERIAGVTGGVKFTHAVAVLAAAAAPVCVPSTAHALAGTALGLVLVFRTNSSSARLNEARVLLGNMVRVVRDLTRLLQYVPEGDRRCEGTRRSVVGYAASIGFAIEAHMRKGRTRVDPDDPTAFKVDPSRNLTRILGETEARRIVNLPGASHNLPMVMNAQASKELRRALKAGMPHMIHRECEDLVAELGKISGGAERIISTPIPLSYTRHTSRSLMIWLLTLPFALWETFHWATVPAVLALTYLTIGLDEIGIQIEEPFSVLPVKPLADVCERDVRALDQLLELGGFPEGGR